MAKYVEGFVIPIQKSKVKEYKKLAKWGHKVWMKYGALSYYECVMDEMIPHGLGFKKLCKLKPNETAIFAFIVYKSKAHRNQVHKGVHKEMDKFKTPPIMPFDMKRFSVAGCKVIIGS